MNIEFANRLIALRKDHGLSQEELAAKLQVSRQAVSKWECGESSPDTDNLVALAKIYGITLDELVHGPSKTNDEVTVESVEAEVVDGKDNNTDSATSRSGSHLGLKLVNAIGFPVAAIVYILLGVLWKGPSGNLGWAAGWVVFLMPIVLSSLFLAIGKRRMSLFQIAILVVIVFCATGIIGNAYELNLWHPYWLEFLLIPIYHAIASFVDHKR